MLFLPQPFTFTTLIISYIFDFKQTIAGSHVLLLRIALLPFQKRYFLLVVALQLAIKPHLCHQSLIRLWRTIFFNKHVLLFWWLYLIILFLLHNSFHRCIQVFISYIFKKGLRIVETRQFFFYFFNNFLLFLKVIVQLVFLTLNFFDFLVQPLDICH